MERQRVKAMCIVMPRGMLALCCPCRSEGTLECPAPRAWATLTRADQESTSTIRDQAYLAAKLWPGSVEIES